LRFSYNLDQLRIWNCVSDDRGPQLLYAPFSGELFSHPAAIKAALSEIFFALTKKITTNFIFVKKFPLVISKCSYVFFNRWFAS